MGCSELGGGKVFPFSLVTLQRLLVLAGHLSRWHTPNAVGCLTTVAGANILDACLTPPGMPRRIREFDHPLRAWRL